MKLIKNRLCALAALVLALTVALFAGIVLLQGENADADTQGGYYYNQLTPEAKRFYGAIDEMRAQGALKTGKGEYDLVSSGVLTQSQLASYSKSSDVIVAFGAARDAYSLDHPEIFYIDFNYLSVSVGVKDGAYVATLGTGRSDNFYIENGFSSVDEVNAAISAFESSCNEILAAAQTFGDLSEKVKKVNELLVEKTEYSFCAAATESGTTYLDGAAHIRTPYGALVNGKAVCEGYARAFKTIMDKLSIECVLVQGYVRGNDGGMEPHMWNYVKLDGDWYGVDATWNDTAGQTEQYLLRGNVFMREEHVPDGIISESNYQFDYPVLAAYDYGVTQDKNGISLKGRYETSGGVKSLYVDAGYAGKDAYKLKEEDGLYLVYRERAEYDGEYKWGLWIWAGAFGESAQRGSYTTGYFNSSIQYVQFAVFSVAPDTSDWYGGEVDEKYMSEFTEPYYNNAFGTYYAPPYIKNVTPSNQANIDATKTYEVVITYTENLKKADENKDITVAFTSQHTDIGDYAKVENVRWSASEPNKLSFTFTPSRMFNHRYETYSFFAGNLVGLNSGKEPNALSLMTEQTSVACNRIYGDGRLYIKSYGEPSLVSAGDLSLTGWKDGNGDYVAQNQRSQLMLVVNKPASSESGDMVKRAASAAGATEAAVLASATYELELDICGHIASIPNGSYIQLAFGFPEGITAADAGVTFKVYHFKRGDDGQIDYTKTEELKCVVTEYGIIVTVTDFSPFAIVAFDGNAVRAEGKGVYARVLGYGGEIAGDAIANVAAEESVTYTLTPNEGYRVDKVLLNGEELAVNGQTVTLAYGELDDRNTLTVSFVAESVYRREAEAGIENISPCVTITGVTRASSKTTDNATLRGVIAVVAVFVVCVAVLFAVLAVRKRKLNKSGRR